MKRILVPTDFSDTSKMAMDFAVKLAKKNTTSITLLHALDFPIPMGDMYVSPTIANEVYEASTASVSRELERLCEHIKDEHGVACEYHVQLGPLTEVIESYEKNNQFDSVIMGTHGASGLKEVFVGSNTEKVIRRSLAPVFSIHSEHEVEDINNILIPTSFEDLTVGFLMRVKQLSAFLDAKLFFLYIDTPGGHINSEVFYEEMQKTLQENLVQNYEIHMKRDFSPEDGIFRFAENSKADMIGMATHGNLGLNHLLNGSLAEDIANHSNIPVWTYNLRADEEMEKRFKDELTETH